MIYRQLTVLLIMAWNNANNKWEFCVVVQVVTMRRYESSFALLQSIIMKHQFIVNQLEGKCQHTHSSATCVAILWTDVKHRNGNAKVVSKNIVLTMICSGRRRKRTSMRTSLNILFFCVNPKPRANLNDKQEICDEQLRNQETKHWCVSETLRSFYIFIRTLAILVMEKLLSESFRSFKWWKFLETFMAWILSKH